eukprot:Hpha_TRINITY_DN27429_c0_g1::TRINITY_DN27429_c0_g1_i1::g.193845::m.193845
MGVCVVVLLVRLLSGCSLGQASGANWRYITLQVWGPVQSTQCESSWSLHETVIYTKNFDRLWPIAVTSDASSWRPGDASDGSAGTFWEGDSNVHKFGTDCWDDAKRESQWITFELGS